MKFHFFKLIIFCLIILFSFDHLYSQKFPADPSKITVSVKMHSVGRHKIVSNLGFFGRPPQFEIDPYPSSNNDLGNIQEINSDNNHLPKMLLQQNNVLGSEGRNAIFLGGKIGAHKVFTCGEDWSDASSYSGYEFFPTGEPWDTIWVVQRDEIVDIPYWSGYKGLSDQDFVCRYDDYHIKAPDQTMPLGVQVIQISHAWGVKGYDVWTYIEFYIIAKKSDIKNMYFGWWSFGGLGVNDPDKPVPTSHDDLCYFDEELKMAFKEDLPGWDKDGQGPTAMKIYPPANIPESNLRWSFNNTIMVNHYDDQWYDILSSGKIDPPSADGDAKGVHGFLTIACGPFNLKMGDTLHIEVVNVSGYDKDDLLQNLKRFEKMKDNNFALPALPPAPPLRVESGNHKAILRWDARPGDVNPETWQDPNRPDYEIEPQPFEGYKVYKKYKGGDWTLLAQYDVADDDYGSNTGLVHEYTDVGLLNNLEYYYCVTSFTKPDKISGLPPLESPKEFSTVLVIPGTKVPDTVGEVYVVPNPYRGDLNYSSYKPPWETPDPRRNIYNEPGKDRWTEYDRRIQFVNLPSPCEIKIYTSSGELVKTISHDDPNVGVLNWNLTSNVGQTIASGIYLFTVQDKKSGEIQTGKFVVIK